MRFLLIFIFLPIVLKAQDYTKLKIKKLESSFHFFQLSLQHDTISDNENDLFYMKISPVKRCNTRIDVQNGQLQRAQSDTIFKLVYFNKRNQSTSFNLNIGYLVNISVNEVYALTLKAFFIHGTTVNYFKRLFNQIKDLKFQSFDKMSKISAIGQSFLSNIDAGLYSKSLSI